MNGSGGSGLRLQGDARSGRTGQWWRATTSGGDERGALMLDPSALTTPGAVDRVVSMVVATRGRPGVLPIADLVSDSGRVWLITAVPAAPTLAELLTRSGLDTAAALTVAADCGTALARLHEAGLVHGALGPDTVVVGASGTISLIEVGLVPALRNTPVPPGVDGSAWAALARTLAGATAGARAAELLRRCAGVAESSDLGAALRALGSGAASLGVNVPQRGRLATAVAAVATHPAGTASTTPAPDIVAQTMAPAAGAQTLLSLQGGGSRTGSTGSPGGVPGGVPGGGSGGVPGGGSGGRAGGRAGPGDGVTGGSGATPGAPSGAGPAEAATRLGRRAAGGGGRQGAPPERANLRFGPGVVNRPPAWRVSESRKRRRRRRGRRRAIASGLVTLGLLAGVGGYLWWQRQNPLEVTAAVVAPAQPPGDQCDVTVDVVGTVQTNGRRGTITYQWIRSDGEASAVLDQSVPDGDASTQVHLFWTFSGEGSYRATATLKILAPTPMETSGEFTYACS
jgi:hypothetical protein